MIREDVFLKSVRQMLCESTDGDGKQKTIIHLEATGTIAKAKRSDNSDGFCNHHRAMIFGYFLSVTRLPMELANWAVGLGLSRYMILLIIILVFLILGCVMDSLAMILLTMPIFIPVISRLGFDPVWFGIIVVLVVEMGVITPPVGMNVYVINGVARDIPLEVIFKGIFPFLASVIICTGLIIAFPQIALFLPGLLK